MIFFIELLQERRIGGCMTKVAGTFHVPSAHRTGRCECNTGHGTWNVPATLRGLVETEAA